MEAHAQLQKSTKVLTPFHKFMEALSSSQNGHLLMSCIAT